MIDYFAIGLTHGLLALAAWRMLSRADLDREGDGKHRGPRRPWVKDSEPGPESPDA